ncbi:MAG: hypothetical protein ABI573_06745 [Chloroflexota bacterium]
MTIPTSEPPQDVPGSGARVRRQLDRAPGERYRGAGQAAGVGAGSGSGDGPASARRAVLAAVAVAVLGGAILTLILGVFASTAGTFAISGLASVAIGLLVANGAIPGPRAARTPGTAPASMATGALASPQFSRDRAVRIAILIALGMIGLTGIGVWILARVEGGVMDPISYLWTTFGFGLPAQAIVALVGSAWGAANGPVRWRQ